MQFMRILRSSVGRKGLRSGSALAEFIRARGLTSSTATLPVASEVTSSVLPTCDILEVDPDTLTLENEAQWLKVHSNLVPVIYPSKSGYMPTYYQRQIDTFNECSFMIRRPYLELIHYMKTVNSDLPVNRFVLYGPLGCGRTITLCQLLHYAYTHDWIVCHVPKAMDITRGAREISMSTFKPGRIDQPVLATEWLKVFKRINEKLLIKADVRTSKKYTWSELDHTDQGLPLTAVVDIALLRPKYASDCVGVILRELKLHASQKKIKILVSIDQANALFTTTKIQREDRTFAPVTDVTLACAFRDIMLPKWNNGIVVLGVDTADKRSIEKPSYLPSFLLGTAGFEHLDPFVAVKVDLYSNKEINSVLNYYIQHHWIQNPKGRTEQGREQLIHLSARSPYLLERLCAAW